MAQLTFPDEWEPVRQFLRAAMFDGEKIEAFCRRTGLPYVPTWGLLSYRHHPSPRTAAEFRAALGKRLPRMPGEGPDLLTDTEVAAMLGVSRGRVSHLKRDGVLHSVGSGRNGVFYLRAEVEALCERRAQTKAAAARDSTPRHCRRCDRPLTGKSQLKYCSRRCSDARRRPAFFPKTPLGKAVNERWGASRKGLTKFSEECGVHVETLKKVLNDEPIWVATFNRLNAAQGGDLPLPTKTVNDVRSEEGKRLLKKLGKKHPFKSDENRKKANETRRGSKRSAETIAKQRKTHETSLAWGAHLNRIRARKGSPEWGARMFLARRLRITRKPSDELLNRWLEEAVAHFRAQGFDKVTAEAVYSVWRPRLVKIGRLPRGGRPREEARHQLVIDLMVKRGLTPADRMPRGFWQAAYATVKAAGEAGKLDCADDLRQWWDDHKGSCFECLTACPPQPPIR